ncbi:MaoC/PaaZ C-terminal domain-containing protein [Gordonia sp. 'Campus']|uniref:MaoC/PaaZ C-terminal domain-containing protein n=1 Tax=Gordonia sp. 'Campus' TaxID=2915824 RepID=UPI001EE3BF76|nr:MaoC/PaaZ C-terminal domain-containing protein [Gordonia sp. 'Campus']
MTDGSTRLWADDLTVGQTFEFGTHHVTEKELLDFARAWDPQDFHVDPDVAARGPYGGLIASGLHTMSIYQKLNVTGVLDNWRVIAGKRLGDVEFLRPVRPGDTLTGSTVIDAIEFDDRDRALVTSSAELRNTDGKPVLRTVVEAYVHARPGRSHT